MIRLKCTVAGLAILLLTANNSRAESTAFADYLFRSGDYTQAYYEYLKCRMTTGDSTDDLLPRIAFSLFKSEQYEKAVQFFEQIEDTLYHDDMFTCYKKLGWYDDALRLSSKLDDRRLELWHSSRFLHLKEQYDEEQKTLSLLARYDSGFRKDQVNTILDSLSAPLPTKHPALGLLFSLVPGGGYVYAQRYGDALFTYALLVPLSAISALYYTSGVELRAGVAGGLAGIFYLGSVYGGVKSVSLFNRKVAKNRHDAILDSYTGK